MPLYDYQCPVGHSFERVFSLDKYKKRVRCACGKFGKRVILPTMIVKDYSSYQCPISGKLIDGRKAHEENLKLNNCRLLEPGEREQLDKRKIDDENKLFSSIDNSVEEFCTNLSSAKKEKLANELLSGVSAEVIRN